MSLTLYPYQISGVQRLVKGSCLLLDEMGLGKTVEVAVALRYLQPERVLIACPKTLIPVWLEELEKWYPGSEFQYTPSSGYVPNRGIVRRVTNYERLSEYTKARFDCFVIDEGQAVKHRRAQRSGFARQIANASSVTWILTGTPISNRADEIWHLLYLTDRKSFGSYWRFVNQWCATKESRWSKSGIEILPHLKVGCEKAFAEMLSKYSIRRTKREVGLQLPAVTRQTLWLEMEPEQKRLHDDLMQELLVEIEEGKTLTVLNVLARTVHARRCAVSPLLLGSKCEGVKFDALQTLLDGLNGEHSVVFSQWTEPFQRYSNLRKPEAYYLTGLQSPKDREKNIADWRENGGPLFATIGTGGVGLTLTEAATVIFLDTPWVPTEIEQAIARLDRVGQKRPVNVYFLQCKDSVEEQVVRALGDKERLITLVNEELRKLNGRKAARIAA